MSGLVELSSDARSKTIGQNFRCRAWVRFNGSNSSIAASANVSSIDDLATNDQRINFTSALESSSYCAVTGNGRNTSGNYGHVISLPYNEAPTRSSIRLLVSVSTSSTSDESEFIYVAIFR
tara:strand:- start:1241 stop:1603 length:363 start_codon:yes stop_codon:yes gene_type:complete